MPPMPNSLAFAFAFSQVHHKGLKVGIAAQPGGKKNGRWKRVSSRVASAGEPHLGGGVEARSVSQAPTGTSSKGIATRSKDATSNKCLTSKKKLVIS